MYFYYIYTILAIMKYSGLMQSAGDQESSQVDLMSRMIYSVNTLV